MGITIAPPTCPAADLWAKVEAVRHAEDAEREARIVAEAERHDMRIVCEIVPMDVLRERLTRVV